MALISPLLWQGIPFRHPEGEPDFYGFHDRWHRALSVHVGIPLADYRFDALPDMGDIHQRVHAQLADALGLVAPSDFSLYDLRQRSGWVLFQQLHSLEHERLRAATGI
jgi:hypothetical protein